MSVRLARNESFELMNCGQCGINFYVPYWFYQDRYDSGTDWYCPNGHNRIYKESYTTQLKKELEATQRRLDIAKSDAHREMKLRQKLEKRIRCGVCPKCSRSFQNLRRHMATKHPE